MKMDSVSFYDWSSSLLGVVLKQSVSATLMKRCWYVCSCLCWVFFFLASQVW